MPTPRKPSLIQEVVERLASGCTVRELALAYQIPEPSIRAYKAGRRGNGVNGRPRLLSDVQERVIYELWSKAEANMYELASIYCVSPQTIKNICSRQARLAHEA